MFVNRNRISCWAERQLRGKGSEAAWKQARHLLRHHPQRWIDTKDRGDGLRVATASVTPPHMGCYGCSLVPLCSRVVSVFLRREKCRCASWSSTLFVINKIRWCAAVCAVNCTVDRRSCCSHCSSHRSESDSQIFVEYRVFLLAFDAHVRGGGSPRRNIAVTFCTEKNESGMATQLWKNFQDVLTESTNVTDRQTDRHRMTA